MWENCPGSRHTLYCSKKFNTHRTNSAGFSSAGKCPHCGITSSLEPGINRCNRCPTLERDHLILLAPHNQRRNVSDWPIDIVQALAPLLWVRKTLSMV